MMRASVGDVVLFKISALSEEKPEHRPLLVIRVLPDGQVVGRLFLDWDVDKRSHWARYIAKGIDGGERLIAATHGSDTGQYLFFAEVR